MWCVAVDGRTCIGSGMCAAVAPGHFRLDGAVSVPKRTELEPDDVVLDAAESCPVEAILVRDADGTVLAPEP
ncbi:hypothetical protein GCM10022243_00110 [Saccharothrix violaceirubra]|uniref:Ferredoxin n=1 Tax=Saccharothrix violaceirubra TaxID=413306 RepID=A0A7W7T3Q5_9PSEU|nr:ferredoxin [Saccharothrix violaceirubra]MBB4965487.1 ferredoxin [Saccharothrix violaceirubra]